MGGRNVILASCVAAVLCGCSSTPKGRFDMSQRLVTFRTEPTGARVTQLRPLNLKPVDLGVTPLVDRPVLVLTKVSMENMPFDEAQVLLEHANNIVVLIEKDGYESFRGTFVTNPSETVEHSITLTPKPASE